LYRLTSVTAVISHRQPDGDDTAGGPSSHLLDATLRCIARWGVAKTSLDDVAREARVSRATVYRSFPGGKDALLSTVLHVEVHRLLDRIRATVEAADTLEDALVAAITETGRTIADHAALQYLLANEPELVLPRFAFSQLDELLVVVRAVGAPLLARFLDSDLSAAERVAEWVARITLSYTLSPAPGVSTADEAAVRTLVKTFVLPGIANLQGAPAK
jgi:AcrR family transcriptional regulator